jgi:hypothetical protein
MMLAVFVVLGVSLGGAFVGGVALGKSQGDDSADVNSGALAGSSLQQQATDQSGQVFQRGSASPEDLASLRERFQSGELGSEELAQIRQRFQSEEDTPDELSQIRQQFGQGSGGRGALTGTVNDVEGNTMTVETAQGPLRATINDETVLQKLAVIEPDDLQAGAQVAVIGQPGEDGLVVARLVFITPEGAAGFFDRSLFSGERPRRDRSADGGDGFQPN